ncbi:MAG: hypothetical protein WC760_12395 [Bacteroidia bacterium]|jgi:hypothetical protein
MDNRIEHLKDFFNLYAVRFNNALNDATPDIEGTVNSFSNCFIAASPMAIACGYNNEEFKAAISQGYAFYKNIGVKTMDIVSLETITLDNLHEMTKVRWKSSFVKRDNSKGSIEFENFYFTQTKKNESKIFSYITGDEQAALKEIGLI